MDKPIIFGAPMVRAILEGRKTKTRRVIKPQPVDNPPGGPLISFNHGVAEWSFGLNDIGPHRGWWRCPYGQFRDRLYVRENFRLLAACDSVKPRDLSVPARMRFEADPPHPEGDPRFGGWGKLRPAIHLPQRCSRIRLTIRDVRVERLQEITEADALAEGVSLEVADVAPELRGRLGYEDVFTVPGLDLGRHYSARSAFMALWAHINGQASLAANSWLWVVDFGGGNG